MCTEDAVVAVPALHIGLVVLQKLVTLEDNFLASRCPGGALHKCPLLHPPQTQEEATSESKLYCLLPRTISGHDRTDASTPASEPARLPSSALPLTPQSAAPRL